MQLLHLNIPLDPSTIGIFFSLSLKSAKGWHYRPNNIPVFNNKFWFIGNLTKEERINLQDEFSVSCTINLEVEWGGWESIEV